jgi:hypothetical protein
MYHIPGKLSRRIDTNVNFPAQHRKSWITVPSTVMTLWEVPRGTEGMIGVSASRAAGKSWRWEPGWGRWRQIPNRILALPPAIAARSSPLNDATELICPIGSYSPMSYG